MALANKLVGRLRERNWRSVDVTQGDRRLEVHSLLGMIGAGFTLWRRLPNGSWGVVTTGHTRDDDLYAPQGHRLSLPDDLSDAIEDLLERASG